MPGGLLTEVTQCKSCIMVLQPVCRIQHEQPFIYLYMHSKPVGVSASKWLIRNQKFRDNYVVCQLLVLLHLV